MRGYQLLLVAGLVLFVAGAASAAYTQPGNGPQRTGQIPFQGPATNDTAFEVQLPGVPLGQPAVDDGATYVTTVPGGGFDGPTDNLTEKAIWRIDLSTGSVDRAFNYSEAADPLNGGWADPDTYLVEDEATEELYAVDVDSGEELWRTKAAPEDPRRFRDYSESVTQAGTVYVIFTVADESQYRGPDRPTYVQAEPDPETVGVMAIDAETGQQIWTWNRTLTEASSDAPRPSDNRFVPETGGMSLSADDERVYVYSRLTVEPHAGQETDAGVFSLSLAQEREVRRKFEIRALSAETGESLWARNDTPQTTGVNMDTYSCCAYPAITETALYLRLDAFQAINPADGTTIETSEAGRSDHIENQGSSAMGTRDGVVVGTSTQSVYRLDGSDLDVAWQYTRPDLSFGTSPVAMAEETVYIPSFRNGEDNFLDIGMEARNLADGELQWSWWHVSSIGVDDPGRNIATSKPALAPDVAVLPSKDGTVTVLGETEASLGEPNVTASTDYPDAGGPVRVDLSGTEAGAFGDATRYKANWGDGSTTGWQEDPVVTHAYNDSGDHTARFWVGNDAGQTSSANHTFHVGEDPPPEPNVAQKAAQTALANENQDITFGVIGIVMAVGGGAIGAARRYRKRSRLQDELDAIERAYKETKDSPIECEAQLTERKTHARGLLLDGELHESQFQVVENRVADLLKRLRKRSLDEEFDFLPHGLVKRGQEMLEDGKVSSLEADAFLQTVEGADMLSPEQKAVVRERIEEWRGRDAGGGGAA